MQTPKILVSALSALVGALLTIVLAGISVECALLTFTIGLLWCFALHLAQNHWTFLAGKLGWTNVVSVAAMIGMCVVGTGAAIGPALRGDGSAIAVGIIALLMAISGGVFIYETQPRPNNPA